MSIPNKIPQVLQIVLQSSRPQVIIQREFYFKIVILNCKDVCSQLHKYAKGEAVLSKRPRNPPKVPKPTLC